MKTVRRRVLFLLLAVGVFTALLIHYSQRNWALSAQLSLLMHGKWLVKREAITGDPARYHIPFPRSFVTRELVYSKSKYDGYISRGGIFIPIAGTSLQRLLERIPREHHSDIMMYHHLTYEVREEMMRERILNVSVVISFVALTILGIDIWRTGKTMEHPATKRGAHPRNL